MQYNNMTDRELLLVLVERSEKTDRALFGNGRPGLVQSVAVLQQDMVARESEALALRDNVAAKRNTAALVSAGVTAAVLAIAGILSRVLGLPLV